MRPEYILAIFIGYFALLMLVGRLTTRKGSGNSAFFTGERKSPWFVVAFGMIGASLSGVTFVSVPGWVNAQGFAYLTIVFGYFFGYIIIAKVLLPLYYRLNLVSIYTYLEQRFGFWSYKSGASLFLISRIIGASFRVFLIVNVLQLFVFDKLGIPFYATTILFIILINLYTIRGGIKTIIWTDTLQTLFMLLALVICGYLIYSSLDLSISGIYSHVKTNYFSTIVVTDINSPYFFVKNFFAGMFITIVMTGLDQDMMQKNLTCKNVKEAKKNMISFGAILIPVNFMFLLLGALLILYANQNGITIPNTTDDLFPIVALNHLGGAAGVTFMIGLIAAAFSSADSAIASLTTSFSVDFLSFEKTTKWSSKQKITIRKWVQLAVGVTLTVVVILFHAINDDAVIAQLFTVAGYTYGPLLGLYSFGLITKTAVYDRLTPYIVVISPAICFLLNHYSIQLFNGYVFGFELLILNGFITFVGLYISNWFRLAKSTT